MSVSKTILVLGGGVGGLVAANRLRRDLPAPHRVVLVEREASHVFAPSLLWVMVGARTLPGITRGFEGLRPKGIEVVRGEVESLDPERKQVVVGGQVLQGDYVIVALGAEFCPEAVKPGPILDKDGNIIGLHGGIAFYTIGQRKGIGAHRGNPKYVVEIDRGKNAIVIGDQDDTLGKELVAEQFNLIAGSVDRLIGRELEVTAKIRYNSPAAEAVLKVEHGTQNTEHRARVIFKKPQRAITPGQSVVFYRGEEALGGGVIQRE